MVNCKQGQSRKWRYGGGVGRIFVQYIAYLYSTALGPTAITLSLLYFIIIFEPRNPWESRATHNLGQNPKIGKFTISISTPNDFTIMWLNSPYSYNSNGGTYMQICALYKGIWNLPCFCLPILEGT